MRLIKVNSNYKKMKKLITVIAVFAIAGLSSLFAQTKVITGTVTSSVQGEGAIPGAAVTVKGTTLGTYTDVSGKYSIAAPENATTLVFSFLGMENAGNCYFRAFGN